MLFHLAHSECSGCLEAPALWNHHSSKSNWIIPVLESVCMIHVRRENLIKSENGPYTVCYWGPDHVVDMRRHSLLGQLLWTHQVTPSRGRMPLRLASVHSGHWQWWLSHSDNCTTQLKAGPLTACSLWCERIERLFMVACVSSADKQKISASWITLTSITQRC